MAALVERFKNVKAPLRVESMDGPPHEAIRSLAKKVGVDLIVMSTHGRTGLPHLLMGSVVERVVRISEVPVLTVRKERKEAADPLNRAPKRILVAFDFSEPAQRALELAQALQNVFHAKIDVLHVYVDPFEGYPRLPKDSLWGSRPEAQIALKGSFERSIQKAIKVDAENMGLHVEIGHPADKILEKTKAFEADLLCIGTTGKGMVERMLLGSVAQRLVRTSPIPVLSVH